jgi:hypothetical protein
MRLWEELSGTIFKRLARPYLRAFSEKSPERILKKSIDVIDPEALHTLKDYVRSCLDPSGGFKDRAGRPDIYYTLFGYFLAEAIGLTDIFPAVKSFTEKKIDQKDLKGVHLHCASILYAKLGDDKAVRNSLLKQVRQQTKTRDDKQPAYMVFISLLACYYLNDFKGLYQIKDQLEKLNDINPLPSPVIAAMLVLQHSFGKNVERLNKELLSFLSLTSSTQATPDPQGGTPHGFKAVRTAPVPDLLSTAVSLYALQFAGHDLRMIRPGCLSFIDLLYREGGFCANIVDPDTDIEYTFYGLLALGSLAD